MAVSFHLHVGMSATCVAEGAEELQKHRRGIGFGMRQQCGDDIAGQAMMGRFA
jgi:hypothetical protein